MEKSQLRHLRVASTCSADWDSMQGDERVRHCCQCKLNVYNLTSMTAVEAEQLIQSHEGRLCVRFYERADGTVLTRDCPVGKRMAQLPTLRRNSLIASALACLSVFLLRNKEPEPVAVMGDVPTPAPSRPMLMGEAVVERPNATMGKLALPSRPLLGPDDPDNTP